MREAFKIVTDKLQVERREPTESIQGWGEVYLMFKRLVDLLCLSQVSSQWDLNALKGLIEM